MANDDKKIGPGDGSEDPWAGLDFDASADAGETFELPDFESVVEDPAVSQEPAVLLEPSGLHQPAVPLEPSGLHHPAVPPVGSVGPADEAVVGGEGDTESFGVPTFDALSLGAQDGVFTDEAAWNMGDPSAGAPGEPADAAEPPLAVFPPADAGFMSEGAGTRPDDHDLLPAGDTTAGHVADGDGDAWGDADALAHLEDASDAEVDPGIVAFTQPESEPAAESTLLGMDESLVVGDAGAGGGESLAGQSLVEGSAIQIGTGQSGILPFEDWSESPDATATDASAASSVDENPFGVPAFDDEGSAAEAGEFAADAGEFAADAGELAAEAGELAAEAGGSFGDVAGMAAAVGGAAVGGAVAAAPVRRVIRKRSGGSGIGAMVSVLLGGVLSIPIVIGLLFWVFKKDPFQIAPKVPASLAFLLPAEFQVAGQGRRPLPGLAGRGETLVASRSLEDLVKDDGAVEEKPAPAARDEEPESPKDGGANDEPAKGDDELFASNPKTVEPKTDAPPSPPQPPPLDTSALDEAMTAADEATSRLLEASEEDPTYKRLLRDWYTTLSKVGEETVALEQKAADTGAEFVAVSPEVTRTIGRILADERASGQFAKLSRMWLKSRGRTSDGVVLPAVLVSSRHVGAWWVSRVRISDDPEVPEVAVLSRAQPDASEGDAVVVLGLVFEPGVVWAAACGRFEPEQADEKAGSDEADGSAVGGEAAGGSAVGGDEADGSAVGGEAADGSAAGGDKAGGSAAGGDKADGSAAGGEKKKTEELFPLE